MSMRPQNKRAQLRHGATTPAQEYHRDVEMREAVKAAVEQVNSAWCDRSSTRQQLEETSGQTHRLDQARAAARVAARADLRARWAREEAEQAVPLAPHIAQLTPDELRKIDSLKAAREAYLVELQTLDANGHSDELRRLIQALDSTSIETGIARAQEANGLGRLGAAPALEGKGFGG